MSKTGEASCRLKKEKRDEQCGSNRAKRLDFFLPFGYNDRVKVGTISSVGQSHRLITGWSEVRDLDGPPIIWVDPHGAESSIISIV